MLRKILRLIFGVATLALNRFLSFFEEAFSSPKSSCSLPTIYIVGAPRSGTTLLYQLMVNYFNVSYPSNLHQRFYGSLFLAELASKFVKKRPKKPFSSDHGQTFGLSEPSEFSAFWYQFFPRGGVIINNSEWKPNGIRLHKHIIAFKKASGRPVVFKNVYNSIRIPQLALCDPNAIFIVNTRDIESNARSILAGRMRKNGSYASWRSLLPTAMRFNIPEHPEEQAVNQISAIYNETEASLKQSNAKFISVEYESLCRNPEATLKLILEQIKCMGFSLEVRGDRVSIPESFKLGRSNLDNDMEDRLDDYLHSKNKLKECKVTSTS